MSLPTPSSDAPARRLPPLLRAGLLLAAALLVMQVPYLHVPLEWGATFFHEVSHGWAAELTGGDIRRLELALDGSGLLVSAGSWLPPVVSFAGYAGAAFFGSALCLVASARPAVARWVALGLAVLVAWALVMWIRDFQTAAIALVLLGLFSLPAWGRARPVAGPMVEFYGFYAIASAIAAPWALVHHDGPSDAASLAASTFVPEAVWILLWEACAMLALWIAVRPHLGLRSKDTTPAA